MRALPLMFLTLLAGLLFASIDVWWVMGLLLLLLAGGIVSLTVFAKARRGLGIACLVCLLLALLLPIQIEMYHADVRYFGGVCEVRGRVCAVQCDENGLIESLVIDDLTIEGETYHGKMTVNIGDTEMARPFVYTEVINADYVVGMTPVTLGQTVMLQGKVRTVDLSCYRSVTVHNVVRGIYYQTVPKAIERTDVAVRRKAAEKVRLTLFHALYDNMSAESAGFAYAFLTGDNSFVSDALLTGYRHSGAAHLLAVSGLHVGLLATALLWLLRKCRCPRYLRTVLLTAVLGVYAWLCNGTPSVVRAVVVASSASLTRDLGCHRDRPSLLAMCGLVLLCMNPLWLYDVSFLLSYGAFAGIVLLYDTFRALFVKVPGRWGDALALNLSVTLSILPFGIYFFGGVSLFSVPFNYLLIPLMSVVYLLLLVISLLAMIPTWGVLLASLDYLLHVVGQAVCWVGSIGYVTCRMAVWQLPVCYVGVGLASPYCLLKPAVRYAAAATIATAMVMTTVFLTEL